MRSHEHRALGDVATASVLVDVGGPAAGGALPLTYGDVVALSGDYFSPLDGVPDGLFALAAVPGRDGARAGSSDELVCALYVAAIDEERTDPRFGPGTPFAHYRCAPGAAPSELERRVRDRYLSLAAVNDDHFVAPGRSDAATGSGAPSAPAAYRRLHQVALDAAARAGRSGAGMPAALAREAAAQHYLTDAFASGHLRTPVAEIRRYWLARYPDFWDRLQRKVAADTARALRDLSTALHLLPKRHLERRTHAELTRRTGRYPELSVGDLVARVFHDWDNAHGLVVEGGGRVFGDGRLDQGDTMALALRAVQAGLDDVEVAHRLGASGRSIQGEVLYRAVRQATGGSGERFRAEAMVPRPAAANPAQNWWAASVEHLWEAPIVGTGGPTVGQALAEMLAPGGEFIRQVDALGQGLAGGDGVFAVPVLGVWLANRCCHAFRHGFVEPLANDPAAALRSVLPASDPGSGGDAVLDALEHHPGGGVAHQEVAHRGGQQRAEVEPGPGRIVGVDVDQHLEAIGGQAPGALDVAQRRLGQMDQRIRPPRPGRPAAVGPEPGVAGGLEGLLHHRPLVGRQDDARPPPAVLAVAERRLPPPGDLVGVDPRLGSPSSPATGARSGVGSGAGSAGTTLGRMRRSWPTVHRRATAVASASWAASAWAHTIATWSSLSEPAAKAEAAAGRSCRRRARATRRRAREAATPQRRATHCSADTMPSPRQSSPPRASATAATTWAVAALSRPMAAARSASGPSQTTEMSPSGRSDNALPIPEHADHFSDFFATRQVGDADAAPCVGQLS